MNVLITGGTGFLGRALVRRLSAMHGNGRICVYSRGEHAQAQMQADLKDSEDRLRFFIGDVRDQDRLERAMQRCNVVIHAAALKRIEVGHYNPDEMVETNIRGTMNVIEAARRARVARVVLVSSDKAYQPVSPYGLSKAMAEHLFLSANRMTLGPTFRVCRYGNVSGSTGSVIPLWRALIAEGMRRAPIVPKVPITDPTCTRFWMRLEQAVDLVLSAIDSDEEMLIPTLPAYRLQDLAIAMGAGRWELKGLAPWEKQHESMGPDNSSEHARRMTIDEIKAELAAMYGEERCAAHTA